MTGLCLSLILVAFVVGVPATWLARALGRRMNALDGAGVAGQVKAPARGVPNTGGVGIYAGVALPMIAGLAAARLGGVGEWGWIVARVPELAPHVEGLRHAAGSGAVLLGALTFLHVLGLVDDRRPLGPMVKLALMLLAAAVAVVGTDSRLLTLLDAHVGGAWLSVAVTVVWIVAVTNAFNFLDNMDGLAGGVAAICSAAFLVTALVAPTPQWFIAAMLALLLGAVLGFLVFNFPWRTRGTDDRGRRRGGASVFMGDGGSLVIGFLIAVLSVRLTYVRGGVPSPEAGGVGGAGGWHVLLTPLVILAVPLYDLCSVSVIRLRQGKSPLVGDLQHFSHRLVRHGLSGRAAVLVIYGCAGATAIGGIALPRLETWQGVLVGAQTLIILGVLAGYEWARTP